MNVAAARVAGALIRAKRLARRPHRKWPRHRIARLLWAIAVITCPGYATADGLFDNAEYRLGRGLSLPALDLTLSGYSSLRVKNLNTEPARLDLRDLSLFLIWDPHPRWHAFTEIELENVFTIDDRGVNMSDTEAEIERLYVDYRLNESISLRGGRYLTPFGRWNQLHADPLVWSVSRPIVTSLAVPDHGTGAAVHGQRAVGGDFLEYHVYLDASDGLDPDHGDSTFEDFDGSGLPNDFDNAAGMQLRYHFFGDRAEIGASFVSFELNRVGGRRHLFGLDALVRWHRAEFSMESAYRLAADDDDGDDWGAFLQGVVPIIGRLHGVGRIEFYSSDIVGRDTHRASLGLAYRPHPATTFKLEYAAGAKSRVTSDGWQASWSILF